jgi:hypothetical protein
MLTRFVVSVVTALGDEKWLWDFVLLRDINHHSNTKLQGQQKFTSGMSVTLSAFEMKVQHFENGCELLIVLFPFL